MDNPVALITGAAKRIGAEITRQLHLQGYRVILHFNSSSTDAESLCDALNKLRPDSARVLQADLKQHDAVIKLAQNSIEQWGRIDALINNASAFYPTPLSEIDENNWNDLFASNAKAPLFLSQHLSAQLKKNNGCIVNIVDIYSDKPLQNHSMYCMAKSSLRMMTKSLALELAPDIRVNAIAPGTILWPEQETEEFADKESLLNNIPLQRTGCAEDIAKTLLFLVQSAPYITGQIINVDGGYSLVR